MLLQPNTVSGYTHCASFYIATTYVGSTVALKAMTIVRASKFPPSLQQHFVLLWPLLLHPVCEMAYFMNWPHFTPLHFINRPLLLPNSLTGELFSNFLDTLRTEKLYVRSSFHGMDSYDHVTHCGILLS